MIPREIEEANVEPSCLEKKGGEKKVDRVVQRNIEVKTLLKFIAMSRFSTHIDAISFL